jgi:hypothetical protein
VTPSRSTGTRFQRVRDAFVRGFECSRVLAGDARGFSLTHEVYATL